MPVSVAGLPLCPAAEERGEDGGLAGPPVGPTPWTLRFSGPWQCRRWARCLSSRPLPSSAFSGSTKA